MRSVLLVDDDPQMTRICTRILRKAGFVVTATNRAFGVLNLVADTRPDVLVIDVNMPGLSGPDLIQLLRADPELAETRVLFYSGILEHELAATAAANGANGFVHKTANPTELVEAVHIV